MDTRPENPEVARRYESVPSELVGRLRQFRTRYPYQRATVDGTPWRYMDTGPGERVLLLLTGAPGIAELSWLSIERLAQRNRVISPDYPPLDTMAGLVDGIAGILDREGIRRAHVLGGSYGGLVAQVFARRHPVRTVSLILTHSLLPEGGMVEQVAKLVRWMPLVPASLLRAAFRMRLGKLIPEGQHPELALSKALLAEIVNTRLTKPQLIGLMRRLVDVRAHYAFAPDDLGDWPGRILLLMAEDDPATPQPAREALAALYPQAQMRLFSGTGHATAVLKRDEYFAAIEEFLRG